MLQCTKSAFNEIKLIVQQNVLMVGVAVFFLLKIPLHYVSFFFSCHLKASFEPSSQFFVLFSCSLIRFASISNIEVVSPLADWESLPIGFTLSLISCFFATPHIDVLPPASFVVFLIRTDRQTDSKSRQLRRGLGCTIVRFVGGLMGFDGKNSRSEECKCRTTDRRIINLSYWW